MTVFMTKEFFERANRRRVEGATTVIVAPRRRKSLSEIVVGVIKRVPEGQLASAGAQKGIAFQPRSLMALLTYCYAKGIYSSEEIEGLMRRDGALQLCCESQFPDWRALRRFRRKNRRVIERCLAETLCQMRAAAAEEKEFGRSGVMQPLPEHCLEDADGRIENAMLMDLMADACDDC